MKKSILILLTIMLFSSSNAQKVLNVMTDIDLKRYTGTWFEIARLPNSFEKKLKCISATYTLRNDGKITVLNKGNYIADPQKSSSANGVAWLPDKSVPGKLKVQFFWPFSGNYWILDLAKDYKYVLVGEPSFKYLWILAREKTISEQTYQMLLQKAQNMGFNISNIIKVDQNCN
jgi:apolipoprotein D and lipocalin family protein